MVDENPWNGAREIANPSGRILRQPTSTKYTTREKPLIQLPDSTSAGVTVRGKSMNRVLA